MWLPVDTDSGTQEYRDHFGGEAGVIGWRGRGMGAGRIYII